MLFATTLTVAAGTAANAPAEAELNVDRGIIHQVDIGFLDGPENEVHAALRSAGVHRIVPTNTGDVVGNNETVTAHLHYSLEAPPYKVVLQGWSPDAAYAHEITVRVHMLPADVLQPPREELPILQRIARAIFGGG